MSDTLILYTINFVRSLLEQYHYSNRGVYLALEQAALTFDHSICLTPENEVGMSPSHTHLANLCI